ncbi:MAG: glycoside hydrolase family 2 TIM barrel-domain containing protein [Caldilineaceae bacterium]
MPGKDATRLVTLVGVMGGPVEWLEAADVACLNRYFGWYVQSGQLEEGQQVLEQELDALTPTPGKPMIITEFGSTRWRVRTAIHRKCGAKNIKSSLFAAI